ncbi:hypothetical protein CMQ_775 [Grosmannia clavigera kw1407]|uniref:Uncharacterized protein n=1 Tax=Grosmannia clavigera (strain kw1407 / UAMH 11150) TaxID=655863 RepID=F0XE78_GROCL|nr:uncharacterized protein CMQ_775 [Grosmannia clavigera kw1407]EFX03847.1 hypothetical protein CMQ_775 [Grosmannia clavigera kw1407]
MNQQVIDGATSSDQQDDRRILQKRDYSAVSLATAAGDERDRPTDFGLASGEAAALWTEWSEELLQHSSDPYPDSGAGSQQRSRQAVVCF